MPCAWCKGPVAIESRSDSIYCGKVCRQRAWRFRRYQSELAARPERARAPMRMAYADPPYPGLARRNYKSEPTYAGEVDHVALLATLATYDGWALSTGSYALRELLPLCPDGARVCAWVKPLPPRPGTYGPHSCWEPLIVVPGRRMRPGKRDWLSAPPSHLSGPKLAGRKPLAFVAWLFALLGLVPGDTLDDLYPGSDIVSRAWGEACRRADVDGDASPLEPARPVAQDLPATRRPELERDGSAVAPPAAATRRAPATCDPSRVGRRRRVPLGMPAD
jgi:hypothetical protein